MTEIEERILFNQSAILAGMLAVIGRISGYELPVKAEIVKHLEECAKDTLQTVMANQKAKGA